MSGVPLFYRRQARCQRRTMSVAQGRITYLYFDAGLAGNSLEDESILFTLELEAVGEPVQTTDLSFGGTPTPLEVANTSGVALPTDFNGSTITIQEPVSTEDFDVDGAHHDGVDGGTSNSNEGSPSQRRTPPTRRQPPRRGGGQQQH